MRLQPLPLDAVPDVVCRDATLASSVALWGAGLAVVAVVAAFARRDRAAERGHAGLWALCAVIAGALQTVVALGAIPLGCASARGVATLVGAALPWLFAAAVVRGGIAPVPPPILPHETRSGSEW